MADKKISIKIDVTKIVKDALYKGEKATYLDATVFLKDEPDQYGNHGMITQDRTGDKDAGVKSVILGNIKVWNNSKPSAKKETKKEESVTGEPVDDLPF